MFASRWSRRLVISAGLALAMAGNAFAQGAAPASTSQSGDWEFTVYPILVWVPVNIGIDVNVPIDGGGGDGIRGEIVDSRFDGAYLGGFSASNRTWRIDADFVWAGIGGDRPSLPTLTVDVDLIYGHATLGRRLYKDLFVTGGVRRMALKYDITIEDFDTFSRKPGLWDPIVGLAWHHVGEKLEFHGLVEAGGFGVGSDSEFNAALRMDWKPFRHIGLTAGYNYLRFTFSDDVADRTFEATQTVSGPVVGIGLYF